MRLSNLNEDEAAAIKRLQSTNEVDRSTYPLLDSHWRLIDSIMID